MSFPGYDGGRPGVGPPAKSKRVWLLAAAAVVVLAVAGVVAWLVIPGKPSTSTTSSGAPAASGPAVTGAAVKQVLLDGPALTKMLNQPFEKPAGSSIYGGLDQMEEPDTPGDCIGVVNVAPRSVYQSADVQSYARQTWIGPTPRSAGFTPPGAMVMFVKEAVVALPSAADAQALFAKFAEQWKRCDGQSVNEATGGPPRFHGTEMHIADVRVTDTVLAASIVLDQKPEAPDTRAIGVQGNCLVGVLVAFTGIENATGSGEPESSSTDVVRAMMERVNRLS